MQGRGRSVSQGTSGDERRLVRLDHPALATVSVRIRRNRRTRHVRLHVDEYGDVTASVPTRFAASRLDPVVRERAEWLHDVLVRMELRTRDARVDLERGDPVRWQGRWLPTRLERGGVRPVVRMQGEHLVVRVPQDVSPHDALVAWYRREARAVFEARVSHWASAFGLRPGRVSVRDQRTRWGSCTHRGDLSFNWRLVLAPGWVLDSIVVHELCHIEELNHSARFWALLDARFPRHREASDWLRDHGPALRVMPPASAGPRDTGRQQPDEPAAEGEPQLAAEPARPSLLRRRRRARGPSPDQISLFGS